MDSTHIEGKFAAAKKFISTLKNKLHKYMTLKSKNVYIDESDDTVNKYNNTYHKSIKMKPADVNLTIYIDFNKYQNLKTFLQKDKFLIGPKNFL